MNRIRKRLRLGLIGAVLGMVALATPAHAVNPQNLDITVSITATKSLSVDTTFYDFGPMAVSISSVSTSSITVTNASGALIETYTLQGADALSVGGTNWTLAASPGTDIYALAGQFSTAQPNNVDGDWSADDLNNASEVVATATALGNGTPAESGAAVVPGATRGLWFRLKTPTVVSDTTQRKATLTLAVN